MNNCILIVDDSKTVRASVSYTLVNAGYEVEQAVNGREAIEIMGKISSAGKRPSMIITDINMPVMDGISFIKEIKKDKKLRFIPVIIFTTESQEKLKLEGKKAGAAGWLVKPFKSEQLVQLAKKFVR